MKKAVFSLIFITILSKIFGFLRDLTLAYYYGATEVSDVFLISLTIPTVVFGMIAAGISTGYIPMYSRIETNHDDPKAKSFTNNLINLLLVFCTGIIGLGVIFTEPLVFVFASGFEGETMRLAVLFTRISLVGIYFTIVIRILSAYLNYKRLFVVPAFIGIPMNIILITSIVTSHHMDHVVLMAVGNVVALFIQCIIIVYYSYKKGFHYRPTLNLGDKHIKDMLIIAVPVIVGSSATQLNKLVDRSLASQIAVGGISSLNYAHTLNGAFLGIFVASISTVLYPSISKQASKGQVVALKQSLQKAITGVTLFLIPVTTCALLFAEPIVQTLFGRGAFDQQAVTLTASAFFFYSIGLIGSGVRVLLSRTFYSLQDTRTPMINTAIAMILNILLNFIFSAYLGIGGLALATSVSTLICALLLFFHLHKKIGDLNMKPLLVSFGKIVVASGVAGVAAKVVFPLLQVGVNDVVSLLLAITCLVFVYFGVVYMLRVNDLQEIVSQIMRKIRKEK